jgi:hypothetical protein
LTVPTLNKNFKFHPKHEEILSMVETALIYFPEIESIKLGTYGRMGGNSCIANAEHPDKINFNIKYMPSYVTIFHELGHHLQHMRLAPSGEKQASIFGLVRMPDHLADEDRMPYIKLVPRLKIRHYCNLAIQYKNRGIKYYIKELEKVIDADNRKNIDFIPAQLPNFGLITDVEYYTSGRYTFARGFEND